MDLVVGPARRLAGAVARLLDIDGDTPEQRRDEVMHDITSPAETATDLMLRHLARSAVWGVMFGLAFPASLIVSVTVSLLAEGLTELVFVSGGLVTFFLLFMACVHILKMTIAYYLPEDRWNPRSRVWRFVMLAQAPDLVVAAVASALVAISFR